MGPKISLTIVALLCYCTLAGCPVNPEDAQTTGQTQTTTGDNSGPGTSDATSNTGDNNGGSTGSSDSTGDTSGDDQSVDNSNDQSDDSGSTTDDNSNDNSSDQGSDPNDSSGDNQTSDDTGTNDNNSNDNGGDTGGDNSPAITGTYSGTLNCTYTESLNGSAGPTSELTFAQTITFNADGEVTAIKVHAYDRNADLSFVFSVSAVGDSEQLAGTDGSYSVTLRATVRTATYDGTSGQVVLDLLHHGENGNLTEDGTGVCTVTYSLSNDQLVFTSETNYDVAWDASGLTFDTTKGYACDGTLDAE